MKPSWKKEEFGESIVDSPAASPGLQDVDKSGQTVSAEELDTILREVDAESRTRELSKGWLLYVKVVSVAFTMFQLYTAIFGSFPPQVQRSVHLSFALLLGFVLYPMKVGDRYSKVNILDIIVMVCAVLAGIYWLVFFVDITYRVGEITTLDFVVGIVMILIVLEACRRMVGYPVLILACVSLAYCYFGKYFPFFFEHRGFSLNRIVRHMYLSTEGILGIPIGVMSTFVFLFLLFGAFLKRTGVGQFFNDVAFSIAGGAIGGPAKVAVLSSALQGTISGSSVANVAGTGSFTIPLMKECGYEPHFAGAVEAAASTGGQLMPPIMGAAAFLMSEFTNIPYWNVALAAAIPATLYFAGIFVSVHIESKRLGLKGVKEARTISTWGLIKTKGILFTPVIVIVVTMALGQTAMRAGLYGIISTIICSSLFKEHRLKLNDYIDIFEEAAQTAASVAAVSAASGLVVGMVTLTGLGLKLGEGLVSLSGGNVILVMVFAMLSSLVLGMGVPTTANYIITSTIVAPALIALDVPIIAAHLFVFYFGIIADITPPVCSAAFTGAAIAGADALKTGVTATRVAIGAFIIPYMFVLNPALVLVDVSVLTLLRILPGAILGMYAIACAVNGWMRCRANFLERAMLLCGGLLLVEVGLLTDIVGALLLVLTYVRQNIRMKKSFG